MTLVSLQVCTSCFRELQKLVEGGETSARRHGKNVCVLLLLKSITCTLVQTGRFVAATGYVAPSSRP